MNLMQDLMLNGSIHSKASNVDIQILHHPYDGFSFWKSTKNEGNLLIMFIDEVIVF
jgi:hypothetical protein